MSPIRVALLLIPLALTACVDKKAAWTAFMQKCITAQFTPPQCVFLFSLSEKAKSDSDDAALLGAVGLGVGMSSSSRK